MGHLLLILCDHPLAVNMRQSQICVAALQVHNEKWVSPYNGGAELAGCGGGQGTFAKRPALEPEKLQVYFPPHVVAS